MDRFLSLVYFWIVRDLDADQVKQIDAKLWRPPKGEVPTQGPWTAEAEKAAFKSLMGQIGARPGGAESPAITQSAEAAEPGRRSARDAARSRAEKRSELPSGARGRTPSRRAARRR